jgi:signal transduction histidine kinase
VVGEPADAEVIVDGESRGRVGQTLHLTAAAHSLKSGDYANANIAVRTSDEVGQLARTFNVMIDVLRQRERERDSKRSISLGFDKPEND